MGCVSSKHSDTASHVSHARAEYHVDSSADHAGPYMPGPSSSPIDSYQQGLIGAARWPDDAPGLNISNKSHTPENTAYCRGMYNAIRQGGQLIAQGRISSFAALWQHATQWRVSSLGSSDSHGHAFASERVDGTRFVTVLKNPYQSVRERVFNHDGACHEVFSHEYIGDIGVRTYRQYGSIDGTTIPMTTISTVADPAALTRCMRQLRESVGRKEADRLLKSVHPDRIEHTNACYLPMIKHHLNALFSQATDPSLCRTEVIDLVARIHWWAASAAPDQRGSAAKAEFVARSVACAHGIELSPFKHGKVPDIEAMLMSEAEFVSHYRSLLEYEPHY